MRMRAIPAATDGLKSAERRVLWTGRSGDKFKSAVLAGATMPIHPHASPETAVDTLAARYGNNIPLLKPYGAFGTLLKPKGYGASRYTSVAISKFTDDVVFRDIEVIPMQENYDGTLMEPVHFLPLIPIALLNPTEGIAIGFATYILPRTLNDIIKLQLEHLRGEKKLKNPMPTFRPIMAPVPFETAAHKTEATERGVAYYYSGDYEDVDGVSVRITKLPYGLLHAKLIEKLDALVEDNTIVRVVDNSKDKFNIVVRFKKGILSGQTKEETLQQLGLTIRHIENFNVVSFDGQSILNAEPVSFIQAFTDWRLAWYVQRYERLRDLLKQDLSKYYDVRTAIKNRASAHSATLSSRAELKDWFTKIGIVNLDYIADLAVYRFTEEERLKNEDRIKEGETQLKEYNSLLSSEPNRRKVYISELEEILKKYTKGQYND